MAFFNSVPNSDWSSANTEDVKMDWENEKEREREREIKGREKMREREGDPHFFSLHKKWQLWFVGSCWVNISENLGHLFKENIDKNMTINYTHVGLKFYLVVKF